MPSCKNGSGSYTGNEPSPKGRGYCSRHEKIGTKKRGKDKKMWVVKSVKLASGKRSRRWFKVLPPAKKSKAKPITRKRSASTLKRKAPVQKRSTSTQKRKAPAPTRKRKAPVRKMSASTRKRKAPVRKMSASTRKRKPTTRRRKRLKGGKNFTPEEMHLFQKYIGTKYFEKDDLYDGPTIKPICGKVCAMWLYAAWKSEHFYLPYTYDELKQLLDFYTQKTEERDNRQNPQLAEKCITNLYEWLQQNYHPTQTAQASYTPQTAQASYTPAHTPSGQSSIERELNQPPLDELARQFEDLNGNLHGLQKLYIEQYVRIEKLRERMEFEYIRSTKQDRKMAKDYYLTFWNEIAKTYLDINFMSDVAFKWKNYLSGADEKRAVADLIKEFVGHPRYEPEDPNIIRLKQGLNFEPNIKELKRLFNTKRDGSDEQKRLFCDTLHKIEREFDNNKYNRITRKLLQKYKDEFLNIAKEHLEEDYYTGALNTFKARGMTGLKMSSFYPE